MSIYEDNIRQLLDSAYSGFGVIELMVSGLTYLRIIADISGIDARPTVRAL